MNILGWVLQALFGMLFFKHGYDLLFSADTLPVQMVWASEMAPAMRIFIGLAEVAGGAGLILPLATKIMRSSHFSRRRGLRC